MADLAQTAQQVVSSNGTTSSPSKQLTASPASLPASPDHHTNTTHSSSGDSYVDLSFNMPDTDDGTSLQDLIDSELAMRISTETIDDDVDAVEEDPVVVQTEVTKVNLLDLVVHDDDDVPPVPDVVPDIVPDAKTNGKCSPQEVLELDGGYENGCGGVLDLDDAVPSNGHDVSESDDLTRKCVELVDEKRADLMDLLQHEYENYNFSAEVSSPVIKSPEEAYDINTQFIAAEQQSAALGFPEEVPSPPIKSPDAAFDQNVQLIAAEGELTEADILFYNTFNQVQSNGESSPSSPEIVTSEGSPKDSNVDGGFNPFATIPPQDLESPVLEAAGTFPDQTLNVDSDTNQVVVDSSCVDFDNRMDVVTNNVVVADEDDIRQTESCPVPEERAPSPEPVSIPEIGVTPPEPGTEYDEDAYYSQLESRDAIGQEAEAGDVIGGDDLDVSLTESEPAEQKEDFDSWTKVSEVDFDQSEEATTSQVVADDADSLVDLVPSEGDDRSQSSDVVEHDNVVDVCINSPGSDSESSEAITTSSSVTTTTEKKTTSKKKGDATATKTKRNKKNKKEEKENISVAAPPTTVPAALAPPRDAALQVSSPSTTVASSPTSSSEVLLEDAGDLLNVSVKELTQTYCSEATRGYGRGAAEVQQPREAYATGVSIKELKSSFSKFDAMSKKTVLHVRSGDASKAQKQFSQASSSGEVNSNCKTCDKQVFQMEAVKAERCVWHKNCFRCKECNKQLTVDMYSSHEGVLYCKPHFKDLFKPKAVIEDDTPGSDKPDLGLEELSQLNVKSRFQAFEQKNEEENAIDRSPSAVNVKRSPSILSKLARFQAKGMDIGVTDESLNGIPLVDSSSSEEEEEEEGEEGDREVVRANRKQRERPVSFSKMEDMKGRWESGTSHKREERREERKQEISTIRSRLFMGHQGKMKEAYQQAVTESAAAGTPAKKEIDIGVSDRARSIKERFERGEVVKDEEDEQKKVIDEDLVDAGYSKKSRSLFLEMDASAAKTSSPLSPSRNAITRDESFKRPREGKSPEREIYRDPQIVRADDKSEEPEVHRSQTASKMLSFFKHMEQSATKEELPAGPKPLKRFTPPPDCELNRDSGSSDEEDDEDEEEEEEEEEETNPNIIRASDKVEDEFLKQAQTEAVRAKSLRAKFERWEEREVERERSAAGENVQRDLELEPADQSSIDTTKSLRARFESMNNEQLQMKEKIARPKVNRFVDIQTSCAEFCATCEKKVYHLEKVETGGKIFHKNCFRCLQCNCILRMDTYTLNSGKLYCIPHFKQIFFAKGNYEEGFGIDQHKRKWASNKNNDILLSLSAQEH